MHPFSSIVHVLYTTHFIILCIAYPMCYTCTWCEWWMGDNVPLESIPLTVNFISTVDYHLYCKLFATQAQKKRNCCRRLKILILIQWAMYCTYTWCEWSIVKLSRSQHYISYHFYSILLHICKLFATEVQKKRSCCQRFKSNSVSNPMSNVLYLYSMWLMNE